MATCNLCKREMKLAPSCIKNFHNKIPFGNEPWAVGVEEYEFCPECGINVRGFHHIGCDVEECPVCHGQLISCKCQSRYKLTVIDGGKSENKEKGHEDGNVVMIKRRT